MIGGLFAFLIRLITGVRLESRLAAGAGQRVFFANHSSHLDFIVVWAALPAPVRARVRPVAAAEYWSRGRLRPWLAGRVFRAVLIPRDPARMREANPLEIMQRALDDGADLIVFPEGTRSETGRLAPFKPGLFHLASHRPGIEWIPVYLENLNRILPKGEFMLVPLMGRVVFGPPIEPPGADETKPAFLTRAREAIVRLAEGNLTAREAHE